MDSNSASPMIRFLGLFLAVFYVPLLAGTITVDDDGPADFTTIKEALSAAVPGDMVILRDGIYQGIDNRNLDFLGKAITVRSENGPDHCVIDCQNEARAFYFHSGEGAGSILEGITILHGFADYGGAILCSGASPTIRGCVLADNVSSNNGGAIHLVNAANAQIIDCTIRNNSCQAAGAGGGIFVNNASPVIRGCLIESNQSGMNNHGGGIYCLSNGNATIERCVICSNTSSAQWGGGLFVNASSPVLTDDILTGNHAGIHGGGIAIYNNSSPKIERCRIDDNTAGSNGGGIVFDGAGGTVIDCSLSSNQATVSGGGIAFQNNCQASVSRCTVFGNMASSGGGLYATAAGASPTISSSLIVVNYASSAGAGLFSNWAYPKLVNCTMAGNVSDGVGGAFCNYQYAPTLTNCILWGNTPTANSGPATITYSDVQDGYTGAGNLNSDPLFANPLYGDYHLLEGSPCFNVGNNAAAGIPTMDRDSKTRILGAAVDLGAYESGPNILYVPQQYGTILAAIDAASVGDTVLVADGVYPGYLHINKTITIRSVNGPEHCILDRTVVWFFQNNARLQGFTIRGVAMFDPQRAAVVFRQSTGSIVDCIIRDNVNEAGCGGIYCLGGSPSIINCTVQGNLGYQGAGIACFYSPATINNCTIVDNGTIQPPGGTGGKGSGLYCLYSAATVSNSILWNNSPVQIHAIGGTGSLPILSYCDVQGGYAGTGNVNLDPEFVESGEGEYRLKETSPCLNRGNNSVHTLPADQDGKPRIQYGQIDVGAYEYSRVRHVPTEYNTIQEAIDASVSGDTILVADGTYPGNLYFQGKGIIVCSEFGPSFCIIDCQGTGRGVTFENAETAASILEGFTIRGGAGEQEGGAILCSNWASPVIRNCILTSSQADKGGALAAFDYARPTIINSIIHSNTAQTGGAIFCGEFSSITALHCTILFNQALPEEHGGAIACQTNGRVVVANSILRDNGTDPLYAETNSTDISVTYSNLDAPWSCGYSNSDTDPLFVDAEIGDFHLMEGSPCIGAGRNDGHGLPPMDMEGRLRYTDGAVDMGAYEYGRDIWVVPTQIATIQEAIDRACYGDTILVEPGTYPGGLDCKGKAITVRAHTGAGECVIDCAGEDFGVIFRRGERANSVLEGLTITRANSVDGGAVVCLYSSPMIVNCLLKNNAAPYGAGLFSLFASPVVTNCTIVSNTASLAGGGVYSNGSPAPILSNCILWGNAPEQVAFDGDAAVITYSDIQGGYAGTGNINADPRFVDAIGGNYSLIDSASYFQSNYLWYVSPLSPCVDSGTNDASGLPAIDMVEKDRICRTRVDMGAIEVQGLDVSVVEPDKDWGEWIRYLAQKVQNGDIVTVPDGIYNCRSISFQGKAFTLRSANGPANCIIQGRNFDQGFLFNNGEGRDSVLSGFTIRGFKPLRTNGAGIFCSGSSPTIINCVITGNSEWGGRGAGLYGENGSSPLLQDCLISGNSGAGVYGLNSSPVLDHCTISYNSNSGIVVENSGNPTVTNCLILGNSSSNDGGGIRIENSVSSQERPSVTCLNCTITGNSTLNYGGGLGCWNGKWLLINTLVWGNSGNYRPDEFHWTGGPYEFVNCHIGGADPKFRNPVAGDYRLLEGSPCFNAGAHDAWQIHDFLSETDLAGNPRVLYGAVDIGAYELEYRPVVPGSLTVTILPEQALADGARWSLGDGQWLESGSTIEGLAAGSHEIVCKPVNGWLEPQATSVCVVGDGQTSLTVQYKSLHFSIGQIPSMDVQADGQLEFYVGTEGAPGQIAYSYFCTANPQGTILFDSATGHFCYSPDPQDKNPFSVTFIAQSQDQTTSQTMEITPLVALPQEFVLFDEPTQPIPDPESEDFIIKEEFENDPEFFNTQQRATWTIHLYGKDIVFQSGHPNDLYYYHNRNDIREMIIYADKVIVRDPLSLPQTHVTIYARRLCFEGPSARIDTTPYGFTIPAADANPNVSGDTGDDGADGLKGGAVTLHVETFDSENDLTGRIVARGGNGQKPGMGRNGANGKLLSPLTSCGSCPVLWPNVVEVNRPNVCYCRSSGYTVWTDVTGEDAITSGRAGSGGQGGDVQSNLDLRRYIVNSGGLAQPDIAEQLHAEYDMYGGNAGSPYPVFEQYYHENIWYFYTYSRFGGDSPAPEPYYWTGPDGQFYRVGHAFSWLHPHVLKMVVGYAKDLYLYRYAEEAQALFEAYLSPLDQYMASAAWGQLSEQSQLEFEQLRDEILLYLYQMENGLDFFGNPPGWAPMLSFEITKTAFEREVDQALQVLYLDYWLGGALNDTEKQLKGLETARKTLKTQIDDLKKQYEDIPRLISALSTESQDIQIRTNTVMAALQQKEQELLQQAQQNVKDRHKVPWWKKATRILGSVLTMSPLAEGSWKGTLITGAGTLMTSITEEFFSDEAWPEIVNRQDITKQFGSLDFDTAMDNWMTDSNVTISDKTEEELGDYLQNLRNASSQIASNMGALKDNLKETKLSNEEVGNELHKIKQADPQFNRLIDDVVELMAQKRLFTDHLAMAMQKTAQISNTIRHNLLAIDALNRQAGQAAEILDPRAKVYLQDMKRRARHRLMKYHYYMTKAYEYRLLEPYQGAPLDLDVFETKFLDIASSTGELSPDDFTALRLLLTSNAAGHEGLFYNIADEIMDRFMDGRIDGELSTAHTFSLTSEEIARLNEQGRITINMFERGIFGQEERDLRIVDLQVHQLIPVEVQTGCGVNWITVRMEHSGVSRLIRSGQSGAQKDGQVYLFHHYQYDSDTVRERNKKSWSTKFDFNADPLNPAITPTRPSEASESLLRSILGSQIDNLMIYARPSAWADITITTEQNTGLCDPIVISGLTLKVSYDYAAANAPTVVIANRLEPENILPYFVVDTEDINGRQDGIGAFSRVYERSLFGSRKVTIIAPALVGGWRFDKWVRPSGNDLPAEYYTDSIDTIRIPLEAHHTVLARYAYAGTMSEYGDMNADEDIDLTDFIKFSEFWMQQDCADPDECGWADLDGNGRIDAADLELFLWHWLN
ncbi:MAG: right-handed parallel beta-helix repeat-containing protein [Sedimentisphaerales bacterium]|nr:right-handed parallel beta-helix repeat-containing protein [Sedimentisphaerales bacterium]